MTSPIDFLGKIPELKGRFRPVVLEGEPVSPLPLAYMVDGKPSMHKLAGIGGYRICDHYLPTCGGAVMIEHSWLQLEIRRMQKEHGKNTAEELLAREYCLKAYGSMLVLHRLFLQHSAESADQREKFNGMHGEFWIVISDAKNSDEEIKAAIAFQFLKDILDKRARPLFSKSKVIGRSTLKAELEKLAQAKKRRKG